MNDYRSVLKLHRLVFDHIEFSRKGFKNENDVKLSFQVQVGEDSDNNYRVTIVVNGEKKEEYDFEVSLTGFFQVDSNVDKKMEEVLINKNAVAILMPYIRSEITLLTAQPETEGLVIPPFNINSMMDETNKITEN